MINEQTRGRPRQLHLVGRSRQSIPVRWLAPLVLVVFVILWQTLVWVADYPTFILPSPAQVLEKAGRLIATGILWRHFAVTLVEVICGFSLGFTVATLLGYWLAKQPVAEQLVAPYVVAMQAVPVVAVAPLLVLWFGSGLFSKILVCGLIVFFPVLVNTIIGVRSVDASWRELMRALNASSWQTFVKVELPGSLPVLFGGLKLGVTLAVVGAVVGEFVGAERGLGALIKISSSMFDTPQLFVALLTLAIMALALYSGVALLEKSLVTWRR